MSKILSGMLLYVVMQQPVNCFDKTKGKEWKASIVVDEDTADEFNETYKKQSAKKVKRSEFKEQYKVDPPEGDSKNLYVITLRRNTATKTGPIPDKYRPRVFEVVGNKLVDVTMTKLPANGSMGQISIDHYESETYGASARLGNVLVTEMIEYQRPATPDRPAGGAEFGYELADDGEGNEVQVPQKAIEKAKPTKTAKAAAKTPAEDPEDDDPF